MGLIGAMGVMSLIGFMGSQKKASEMLAFNRFT